MSDALTITTTIGSVQRFLSAVAIPGEVELFDCVEIGGEPGQYGVTRYTPAEARALAEVLMQAAALAERAA